MRVAPNSAAHAFVVVDKQLIQLTVWDVQRPFSERRWWLVRMCHECLTLSRPHIEAYALIFRRIITHRQPEIFPRHQSSATWTAARSDDLRRLHIALFGLISDVPRTRGNKPYGRYDASRAPKRNPLRHVASAGFLFRPYRAGSDVSLLREALRLTSPSPPATAPGSTRPCRRRGSRRAENRLSLGAGRRPGRSGRRGR